MKLQIEWEIPDHPVPEKPIDQRIYRSGLAAKMSYEAERRFDIHIPGWRQHETHTMCHLWLTTVDYAHADADVKDQKRCQRCLDEYSRLKRDRIRVRINFLDQWYRQASLVHLIALVKKKAEEWGEEVEIKYERRESVSTQTRAVATGIGEPVYDRARDAKGGF